MKVVVIGGGPGGYVAAIRASLLNAEVVLIEKDSIGGTCLNVGCIPTKALLHSAKLLEESKNFSDYGIDIEIKGYKWKRIQEKKSLVVNQLVSGVRKLLEISKIQIIKGEASFVNDCTLEVKKEDGNLETIKADKIIIATGSMPIVPQVPGIKDHDICIDSTKALSLEAVPKTMVVIGGGVIGIELATIYSSFGTKVIIVEALSKLLPMMDGEFTDFIRQILESKGITIMTEAKVTSIENVNGIAKVNVESNGNFKSLEVEKVLVSVGRRTNVDKLNLDKAGILHDKGRIRVNEKMETNIPSIYAIGDCLGKVMLAHVASVQGEIAAENALGHNSIYDGKTCPSCVYTNPEFAGVGFTEEELKEKGILYTIGKFPLYSNSKSLIENDGVGIVKLIFGEKYGELLGAHILGPRATDIIGECALALRLEATKEEIISTIHGHPTITEAIREAALAAEKRAIHIPNK